MTYLRVVPRQETGYGKGRLNTNWTPSVDIIEGNDSFTLEFDLPGFKKENFKVNVNNGVLEVSGERKGTVTENKNYFRSVERDVGNFSRSFRLPDTVNGDSINGSYENGVLKLEIPKKEEAKPHKIEIK